MPAADGIVGRGVLLDIPALRGVPYLAADDLVSVADLEGAERRQSSAVAPGDLLIIVEVRTRASEQFGGAAASIGRSKQRRIVATAGLLLQRHRELRQCRVRFDVIIVRDGAIEWLNHAFHS